LYQGALKGRGIDWGYLASLPRESHPIPLAQYMRPGEYFAESPTTGNTVTNMAFAETGSPLPPTTTPRYDFSRLASAGTIGTPIARFNANRMRSMRLRNLSIPADERMALDRAKAEEDAANRQALADAKITAAQASGEIAARIRAAVDELRLEQQGKQFAAKMKFEYDRLTALLTGDREHDAAVLANERAIAEAENNLARWTTIQKLEQEREIAGAPKTETQTIETPGRTGTMTTTTQKNLPPRNAGEQDVNPANGIPDVIDRGVDQLAKLADATDATSTQQYMEIKRRLLFMGMTEEAIKMALKNRQKAETAAPRWSK
jgi:hypothetical protein